MNHAVNQVAPVFVVLDMRLSRTAARAAPLLAAVLIGAAGCGSAEPAPAPEAGAVPSGFTISGYRFPELTAAPGETITITNGDGEPHTVTADDGSFDSGVFDSTAPGTVTAPTEPGSYPIHCTIHPAMRGALTVR